MSGAGPGCGNSCAVSDGSSWSGSGSRRQERCAPTSFSAAWLDALPVGGRIATTITGTSLIPTAQRTREGVFGRIERDMAGFMAARHDGGGYAATWTVDWGKLATAEGEHVGSGRYPVINIPEAWDLQGLLEIECPGITHRYEHGPDGRRTALMAHGDGSWARVTAYGLDDPLVHQPGARRLWDEATRVREIWLAHGETPRLGANAMVCADGTIKLARGAYRATIGTDGPVRGAQRRTGVNGSRPPRRVRTLRSMSDLDAALLADVRQLRDLLSVLPNLDDLDKHAWWHQYAAAHHEHRNPGTTPERKPGNRMMGKLKNHLDQFSGYYEHDLAADCLRFFDDPSPEMIALVGREMGLPGSGARILDSICAVAWRIYAALEISEDRVARY